MGSPLLAHVIREMGFRKADDFYIALGGAKISPKVVAQKVLQRLKQGDSAAGEPTAADILSTGRNRRRPESSSTAYGIQVEGIDDVMLRLAKCCRPVPGDPIVGYISLGRGITIHREDCPNAEALRKDPERFTAVSWDGEGKTTFKVELHVDAWDRHRLLEDLSRTFAETGINILEARCIVSDQMVRNRFVVEVGDTKAIDGAISRLRNIDAVFDAYRVTPGGAGGGSALSQLVHGRAPEPAGAGDQRAEQPRQVGSGAAAGDEHPGAAGAHEPASGTGRQGAREQLLGGRRRGPRSRASTTDGLPRPPVRSARARRWRASATRARRRVARRGGRKPTRRPHPRRGRAAGPAARRPGGTRGRRRPSPAAWPGRRRRRPSRAKRGASPRRERRGPTKAG